jgi:hypothetical protein
VPTSGTGARGGEGRARWWSGRKGMWQERAAPAGGEEGRREGICRERSCGLFVSTMNRYFHSVVAIPVICDLVGGQKGSEKKAS